MTASERREEIIQILQLKRYFVPMRELAEEFGVSTRTIRSDMNFLETNYPLETAEGNGGGVKLADWYKPHRRMFRQKHIDAIKRAMPNATEEDAEAFQELLQMFA